MLYTGLVFFSVYSHLRRGWVDQIVVLCGLVVCIITSFALLGTRGISLRGTTPRGVTFYSLSTERVATRFIFNGNPLYHVCPPGGTGRVGQCREIELASHSQSYTTQTRVLRWFWTSTREI